MESTSGSRPSQKGGQIFAEIFERPCFKCPISKTSQHLLNFRLTDLILESKFEAVGHAKFWLHISNAYTVAYCLRGQ